MLTVHHRAATCLAALLCTWLCLQAAHGQASWEMSADVVDVDQAQQQAHAEGSVQVNYDGIGMTADEADADLERHVLQAEGNVCFSQGDRLLSGEQLHYDLGARHGWLTGARGKAGPVLFSGDRVEMWERKVTAKSGTFTTCDLPHPHYRITAREITLVDGRRAILRGAELWYHNRRLLRLPKISQNLRPRGVESQGLVPRSGYARGDGPFVGLRYLWTLAADTDASVELRATTGRGLRGISRAARQEPWGSITLAASTKEDIGLERVSNDDPRTGIRSILVDKLPELKVLSDRRTLTPWLGGRVRLTAGRYSERESGVRASRFAATIFASAPDIPIGKSLAISPGLAARRLVAGSDTQTVLVGRLSLQAGKSDRSGLRLSYIQRSPHGNSPFLFDEVEIEREVNVDALARLGRGWRTEAVARYDLDRTSFRDVDFTVGRRVHCLDYSLSWSKTRAEFRVQVGLANL